MQMMNVGIIGFGRIGAEHAQLIAQSGARVAAVFDPTAARRELALQRGLKPVATIGEILRDESIPVVLISTPTSMHFEHTMAALEARKHVMVEKPMALDLSQARQMAAKAENVLRVLSVFHNRRWDIDYLTMKSAIASGVLGQVINIESRLGQWSSCVGPAAREWHPQWRNEASYGGGGLYDWGSHFIDQVWQLMLPARPVRVFAQLRGNIWTRECDDFARVCINFDNGAVGLVEINTTTTRPLPRWHVDGTAGSAESPYNLEFDTGVWASLRFTSARGGERAMEKAESGLNESEIWRKFLGAAAGRGEPAVSTQSVLITMALLDAARESNRHGSVVEVNI
jgi:predicted dehydrogenase